MLHSPRSIKRPKHLQDFVLQEIKLRGSDSHTPPASAEAAPAAQLPERTELPETLVSSGSDVSDEEEEVISRSSLSVTAQIEPGPVQGEGEDAEYNVEDVVSCRLEKDEIVDFELQYRGYSSCW